MTAEQPATRERGRLGGRHKLATVVIAEPNHREGSLDGVDPPQNKVRYLLQRPLAPAHVVRSISVLPPQESRRPIMTRWLCTILVGGALLAGSPDYARAQIEITPDTVTLEVGERARLRVKRVGWFGVRLPTGKAVWITSPEGIVDVRPPGQATGMEGGTALAIATLGEHSDTAIVTVRAPERPGRVEDLRIIGVGETWIELEWTQVWNGWDAPADYAVRHDTTPMSWGGSYPNEEVVRGNGLEAPIRHRIEDLLPGVSYDVRMITFRGVLNESAVFGPVSSTVTATTEALDTDVGFVDVDTMELASENAPDPDLTREAPVMISPAGVEFDVVTGLHFTSIGENVAAEFCVVEWRGTDRTLGRAELYEAGSDGVPIVLDDLRDSYAGAACYRVTATERGDARFWITRIED